VSQEKSKKYNQGTVNVGDVDSVLLGVSSCERE